jgi:hypothetical protein
MPVRTCDIDTRRLMLRLRYTEYKRLRDQEHAFLDVSGALQLSRRRLSMLAAGRGSRRFDSVSPRDLERYRDAVDGLHARLVDIRKEILRREKFLVLLERCENLFDSRPRGVIPVTLGLERDSG